MKVSGFTFYRNAEMLGYPIAEAIRSILPLVDEFVIALGPCVDRTEAVVRAIGDPKIRNQPRKRETPAVYVLVRFHDTKDTAITTQGQRSPQPRHRQDPAG